MLREYGDCLNSASKFKSLRQWKEQDCASFSYASRYSWQRKIAVELNWIIKEYKFRTRKDCLEEAKKYSSLTRWKKGNPASYLMAYKMDWHRKIAIDLNWWVRPHILRSYPSCLEIARKYTGLLEWRKKDKPSYETASRRGWHRKIEKELGYKVLRNNLRTYEECLEAAKKFKGLGHWQKEGNLTYQYAYVRNWHLKIADELKWVKYARV